MEQGIQDEGRAEQLEHAFTALQRLVALLEHPLTEEETLRQALSILCGLVRARYGAIGLVDGNGRLMRFINYGLNKEQETCIGDRPRGIGLLGLPIKGQQAIRLDDLTQHPHHSPFPRHHPPMTTFLGAAVVGKESIHGRLYLTEKADGQPFTESDAAMVSGFARGLGAVVENVRLVEHLRQSEARFRTVLEAASDGIVVIDAAAKLLFFSPAAERMFGYASIEVAGRNVTMLVPRELRSSFSDDIARHMQTGRSQLFGSGPAEMEGQKRSGDRFPLEITMARTSVIDSHLLVGIMRDISARKALERAREDFIAMLTHDIRNPLAIILGYTDMLRQETASRLTEEEKRMLISTEESAGCILNLVQNFLLASRIDEGELQLPLGDCDLNQLIVKVAGLSQPIARSHGLRINVDVGVSPCIVRGNDEGLERVISNLVINALRHSPQGEPVQVTVRARRGVARLSVSDRGPGICAEDHVTLFRRYGRAHGDTNLGSTGLGLYIVKAIMDAHGGTVAVDSSPGNGATFTVCLPLAGGAQ